MSSTTNEVPPSPRHILCTSSTSSFALSDAVNGALSFASVSAAAFSAVTAPSTIAPHPRIGSAHRYNTRYSCRVATPDAELGSEISASKQSEPSNHHRHVLPERASRLLATATANARLARVLRRSNEMQKGTNADTLPPPLLASTPSKSSGTVPFQPILNSNTFAEWRDSARSSGSDSSSVPNFGGWLTARSNLGSHNSAITIGSSVERESNSDSIIVLDDTEEDENNPVFRFVGKNNQNESNNDSVVIVSPEKEKIEKDVDELVEEPLSLDDSICVTRHKVNRVCPITKLPFENPVRNCCGHVYEKSAILEMCLSRWRRFKPSCPCPVSGCEGEVVYTRLASAR